MIEATLWHPVAESASLADSPLPARLLSQELVLWRDAAGVAHAWADRCPHRGTSSPLMEIRRRLADPGYTPVPRRAASVHAACVRLAGLRAVGLHDLHHHLGPVLALETDPARWPHIPDAEAAAWAQIEPLHQSLSGAEVAPHILDQ